MMPLLIVLAAVLAGVLVSRSKGLDMAALVNNLDAAGAIGGAVDSVLSGVENMFIDIKNAVLDANVQAFLKLIRTGEGTSDAAGYSRLFGGKQFAGYAKHPNVKVPFGSTYSTAAGAYQILSRTWNEIALINGLQDFTPHNQDLAAVALIKRRGALADVIAGRFRTAIVKCNQEWASLPLSPYGQPTMTMIKAGAVLASLGVHSAEVVA